MALINDSLFVRCWFNSSSVIHCQSCRKKASDRCHRPTTFSFIPWQFMHLFLRSPSLLSPIPINLHLYFILILAARVSSCRFTAKTDEESNKAPFNATALSCFLVSFLLFLLLTERKQMSRTSHAALWRSAGSVCQRATTQPPSAVSKHIAGEFLWPLGDHPPKQHWAF